MPPKAALTSSFLVSTDTENEVVCPLTNQDGSQCRKRCIGVRACPGEPRPRPMADSRPHRKNGIGRCRSTFDVLTPTTTFLSCQRPKKAFS